MFPEFGDRFRSLRFIGTIDTKRTRIINQMLDSHIPGTVELASEEYLMTSQKRYRKSGWLEPIGIGAFVRPGEQVSWEGASMRCKPKVANQYI
ncbi:MAG: AbiEi antitoxin N-terminal domain-containing protein [Candidatus Chlorobium antarcticum]|jgi:hypothetical protein|nr:AbiEi antitoxin N-terminal domain-containing protein [Candidatus Chlorobium antarcticum]